MYPWKCRKGGLCYEPFSGSGSQIIAGESTGRRVFAMEISPTYVDVAIERGQTATGGRSIKFPKHGSLPDWKPRHKPQQSKTTRKGSGYYILWPVRT